MSIITIGLNPAIDRIVTARRESPFEPVRAQEFCATQVKKHEISLIKPI